MIISNIPVFDAVILITVFAHEDTNNFICTKYLPFLLQISILCADTVSE